MTNFNPRPNFPEEEEKLVDKWKDKKIFERSVNERPRDRSYTFYDGPPFATGLPHYGHLVPSLIKDMVPRFWTMRGYRVERKWGWDCHGLPIENIIEKELGLKHKKDIVAMGIDKFNEACEAKVLLYAEEWKKTIARYGRWADMENDYKTMDLSYMESLWWVFKSLWDRGLIYEGKKSMHICPRCETPLSNFEVTQGYKEVTDVSVIWKFPLVNKPDTFLLAWTTTPWSTPSTMALAVGPTIDYVKVRVGSEYLLFAKERLAFVLKGITDYEVVEEMKGIDLAGLKYEPLLPHYKTLPDIKNNPNVYQTYLEDYVEVTEGTGIVTINGSYGEVDYQAAQRNHLPIMMDVNMDGTFNAIAGAYEGMDVKVAEKPLVEDMQKKGRVLACEPYIHSYPHCWRCETPLLSYMTSSWFVKVTAIKEPLLKNNQMIHWVPEHMKDGRFGTWLADAKDWAISRSRYWGTPLPVWRNVDDPKDILCVGSVAELEKYSGMSVTNLHKHFVDDVVIKKDGKTYKRIPEVLDCWFESGSMPYAQRHYPFEHAGNFLQHFPAEFIAEAQDQTRGWFYTLHVLATALTTGDVPVLPVESSLPAFKNVIVNGIVLAEDGKKMAKRLKNYPEPDLMFHKYGADSVRYYLATSPVMKSENVNFSEKGVAEVFRKFVLTLWNVVSFYKLYETTESTAKNLSEHILDQWILAKLEQVKKEVTQGYEHYDINKATRPLMDFVLELSTWYVRRSRDRFKGGNQEDKAHALATLQKVLHEFSQLLAPVMPFTAEMMYKEVGGKDDSVHLSVWPEEREKNVNDALLNSMESARKIIEIGHALRATQGLKVRQPLQRAESTLPVPDICVALIAEELNVKEFRHVKTLTKGLVHDDHASVGLDIVLTDDLKHEGYLRELVRAINAQRKKQGLTIHDQRRLTLVCDDAKLQAFLEIQKSTIATATKMSDVTFASTAPDAMEVKGTPLLFTII